MSERPDPTEDVRRLYEDAEKRTADAMEELVKRDAFGELLARATENILAVTRIGNDAADLVVRNLRLAGRRDITSLGRQLARTEDKLEQVLQEVERLQEQLAEAERASASNGTTRRRTTKSREQVNAVEQLVRAPVAAVEFANLLLTRDDAKIGVTPKDVVWTHRKTTLYRYRSTHRTHALPVLLVFALINRPEIFDLRPGNSFVEFLLEEGYDVFLLDWGVPGDEDADMGIDNYVLDELPWGMRETLRASGQEELSLLGWCIGGSLVAMHAALEPGGAARNLVLLTTPVDTTGGRTRAGWGATPSTRSSSPRCCRRCPAPASTGPTR